MQVLLHAVRALRRLHGFGYAHRDIKPGNILRRPKQHDWTLIDFGCTTKIGAGLLVEEKSAVLFSCMSQLFDPISSCSTSSVSPAWNLLATNNASLAIILGRCQVAPLDCTSIHSVVSGMRVGLHVECARQLLSSIDEIYHLPGPTAEI